MIDCQRHLFSLDPEKHFINCGYMSPLLKTVEEAGILGIKGKRNPHLTRPEDFFENSDKIREVYSHLINNPDPKRIALIPSVSYGMANVAKNIRFSKGEEILLAGYQFPSNYYPWRQLCDEYGIRLNIVYPPESFESRGKLWGEKILEEITDKTRVVALGHIHWADGTRFPLKEIKQRLSSHDGYLIVDGTQSVGALPFDIQEIKPDALVVAGYKWLLGPYSTGLAYYGERFDKGKPIEENWINRKQSHKFSELVNYQGDYEDGALRYEVGERSNFILLPMLLESLRQIQNWGIGNIQTYCRELNREIIDVLKERGFFIEDSANRAEHLYGIYQPEGISVEEIRKELEKQNVIVSVRGASIRVSPHLYNTKADMKALKEALLGTLDKA